MRLLLTALVLVTAVGCYRYYEDLDEPVYAWGTGGLCADLIAVDGHGERFEAAHGCEDGRFRLFSKGHLAPQELKALATAFNELQPPTQMPEPIRCTTAFLARRQVGEDEAIYWPYCAAPADPQPPEEVQQAVRLVRGDP